VVIRIFGTKRKDGEKTIRIFGTKRKDGEKTMVMRMEVWVESELL